MIRLFHVSDVHFGAEDAEAIAWFDAAVAQEKPDAIIMTGDLTMRARSHEFAAATAWLEGLEPPVTVEVGNHDLPAWNLFARLFRPYGRFKRLERLIERPLGIQGVSVVPLKTTARFQLRNWSKGRVSPGSLKRALAMIRSVPKGNLILVAAHHPLVEAGTRSTAKTTGGPAALAALAQAGAHAVLTGHVHDPFDIAHDEGGQGCVRLIGAGTLSKRVRDTPPSFNEIRIENGRLETIARKLGASDAHVTDPGDAAQRIAPAPVG